VKLKRNRDRNFLAALRHKKDVKARLYVVPGSHRPGCTCDERDQHGITLGSKMVSLFFTNPNRAPLTDARTAALQDLVTNQSLEAI
jgi:hypothetical protein